MKVLFRILAWTLGLAVAVIAVAAVVIPLYLDPNDYKGPIARQVERRIGRPVDIQGGIRLSVFPWLGLELERVTVGNPPGFADPVFAAVERADVRVKLLPLLRREVEADTLSVRGLDLRLVMDRTGRTNWQDLAGAKPPGAPPAPPAGESTEPLVTALAIGGVDLRDARIAWSNEATGQRMVADDLDLKTGAIAPGQPVPLTLAVRLRASEAGPVTELDLEGRFDADPTKGVYRLREIAAQAKVSGPGLPAGGLPLTLRGQGEADLRQQVIKAVPVTVTALGMEMELAVVVEDLQGELRYSAAIDTRDANLRAVIEGITGSAPTTADPAALTRVTLGTRIAGTPKSLAASPLVLRLDDTSVEGKLELPSLDGPAVRFDLTADRLDLDRYLPPAASGKPPATPAAAGAAAASLPLDTLRGLDLDGQLRVDHLTVSKLRLTDVSLTVRAKDGVVTLDPAQAQLYEGAYSGRSRLDVRGAEPRFSLEDRLTGVQAEPLLRDFFGEARLTGTADVAFKLQASGLEPDAALRSLGGDGRFSFRNGAVRGVNLGRTIRQAKALLEGRQLPAEEETLQTDFSELRGTVRIAQGVARNDDLSAKSPLLRVEGRGSADLVRRQLDYLARAVVVGTAEGQGGREADELTGVAVPIRITGPFDQLSYKVELDEGLKARARDEARQKVEEAIDKKLGGEAGEKAKDLLRGLFR